MRPFADTSLLCALYRRQDNTDEADTLVARFEEPLCISSLVAFEFRQSTRLQVFRFSNDRTQGFSKDGADKMFEDFEEDLTSGAVEILPVDWGDVHSLAERLSARKTMGNGHRTLDVLHVATALHAGLQAFLTFDANQAGLAESEGLEVPGFQAGG
ncbi:MAG: type II toxin-antitoxin system VapC family toxin [Verrucomicrobia bacterium]|nr:type II toxin-antitoxin system VapC family toxin [Verrucomicrobiota bacterium]